MVEGRGQNVGALGEAIGAGLHLGGSSDAYAPRRGHRRALAVESDPHAASQGACREPITDAGTAHRDRLTWVTRRQLTELVAELHPDRHAPVTNIIRELIGNI